MDNERIYKPKEYTNEELKHKCGIYQIRNLVNNKLYVGSTVNLNKRKKQHFNILKKNKHVNKYLQNAYNKYGENNFVFEVIEILNNKDFLIKHEQFWIDKLKTIKKMYNICFIAGNTLGVVRSEMTKNKISISNKNRFKNIENTPMFGKHHTEESKQKISQSNKGKHNHFSKKIICLETLIVYNSTREAERLTNISHSNISRCCKNSRKTAGGYHWEYLKN